MQHQIYTALEDLPENTNALFSRAQTHSFFLGKDWFENYCHHLKSITEQLQIHTLQKDHETLVVLPAYLNIQKKFGLPVKYLQSLSNYYSSQYAPLMLEPENAEHLKALFLSIQNSPSRPDAIELGYLEPDTALYHHLIDTLKACNFEVFPYVSTINWYLPVIWDTYDAYLASRDGKVRNTLKRKTARIKRDLDSSFKLYTRADEWQTAYEHYDSVYARSWKEAERFPDFIKGLMHFCFQNGWARVGVLFDNNKPCAAQFWINCHGRAHIYKLSYDEKYANYSPGSFVTAKMFENAINIDRVKTIDYLNGNDNYKQQWMSHQRNMMGLLAVNRQTLTGRLFAGVKNIRLRFN